MSPPSPPARRRARRRERGFTLIELTVASALMLLALAVATGALVAAGRLFALAPASLRGGEPELAERLLRADLAAGAPAAEGGLPGEALVLERDGLEVVWELDGSRLRRSATVPGSPPAEGRVILDAVLFFQWQLLPERTIVVRLVRRTPAPLTAAHLTTPGWYRSGSGLEAIEVVVASRRDW
jgi:prepilin-type N-terminal cleavage/methylation domain-containing protein